MTYRRTWFGYVLWVIYAGLCVTMLAFIGFTLWKEYIPFPMAQAGAFFIFPLLLGVYALLRTASWKIRTKYKKLKCGWRDLVAFFFVAALIAGVVLLNIYCEQIFPLIAEYIKVR